jgi:hypothetical protein
MRTLLVLTVVALLAAGCLSIPAQYDTDDATRAWYRDAYRRAALEVMPRRPAPMVCTQIGPNLWCN